MAMKSAFYILLLGALSLAAAIPDACGADSKKRAIKIFSWQGPGTGWDSDVNQNLLKTNSYDTSDVDWYQSADSVEKLKKADVVYIANHGGRVTSQPVPLIPWVLDQDYPLEKLGFSRSAHKGPSIILNWGCQNGNDAFVKKDGTKVNLLQQYAQGMGIDCDSPTKVYIAPKVDVDAYGGNSFQEAFFAAFSKGDVTVRDAAKCAFEARQKAIYNPNNEPLKGTLDEFVGICGNANLTLNQLRENLALRQEEPTQSVLLLIDSSGSMKGKKIEIFKRVAINQVNELTEDVEAALITFNGCGSLQELYSFNVMTEDNKRLLCAKIAGINPDGDTNLAEATAHGWAFLDKNARSRNHSLVLLTDGVETCNGDPVKAATSFSK